MKFRAKLTIAMVLLLSLTYGIGGSLMIAQSFSASIDRERDAAVQPRTGRTQRRKKRPARRSGREWYDDAQKTRKRRRSAEHAASGPQLTPEVPPPRKRFR